MNRYFRWVLIAVCIAQLFLAVAYILRLRIAVQLWPLPYTSDLALTFIGSIYAAAAVATLWVVLARETAALAGIALDYLTILAPTSIFAFQMAGGRQTPLLIFGIVCVVAIIVGVGLLRWGLRHSFKDTRPTPRFVRAAFLLFTIALLIVGTQLITKTPNILPWTLSAANSVIYGWMFLGAAAYFIYALLRPVWGNAVGQLMGFFAYDLVLIVPFLTALPTISDARRFSLILYIIVVSVSGALAIYYCFIHPEWRIWRARPGAPPASVQNLAQNS